MAPEVPADTGNLLTQKAGPLPMWGWGVVILGAAYGVKLYRDHKNGGARTTTPTTDGYTSADLPSNIQPQYTVIDEGGSQSYVNSPVTTIGRQYNDIDTDVDVTTAAPPAKAAAPPPKAAKPVAPPKPKPAPAPVHVPSPQAPSGQWVTVVKWNPADRNAPSTLSGLALKAYGNASAWQKIWNAPQNADLVKRRGDPTKIQPGDKFFAPA